MEVRRGIAEAARLVKHGGTIAFIDWVEGRNELNLEGAARARCISLQREKDAHHFTAPGRAGQ